MSLATKRMTLEQFKASTERYAHFCKDDLLWVILNDGTLLEPLLVNMNLYPESICLSCSTLFYHRSIEIYFDNIKDHKLLVRHVSPEFWQWLKNKLNK